MPWILLFCVLAIIEAMPVNVTCMRLPDIHWNITNPIFRIDNTDHIIDVNKGNIPFEYDQVNIICPVYQHGTKAEDTERYIIYNVSKEEYDSCRITNPSPRIIAVCDKPYQLMYFTITFRSFTPQPGGLEFRPGQDYYFISTSDGRDGLHSRIGGRCATHNMKVIFKVCCDSKRMPSSTRPLPSTAAPKVNISNSSIPVPSTALSPTTSRTTTTTYSWPIFSQKPNPKTASKVPNSPGKKIDHDKMENDVAAKNEELVNSQPKITSLKVLTVVIGLCISLLTR